jgi:hypothetical protein
MADAYVIEVSGYTAGIVARDHGGEAFTFFASNRAFEALEGKRFSAPAAAAQAARRLIKQRRNPRGQAAAPELRP